MTQTPPEMATTTAEMLARLQTETVFLEADALAWQMQLEDAQDQYRRGRLPLAELLEAQASHREAVTALEAHRQEVTALEAECSTETALADIERLRERMAVRTLRKISLITERVTTQEAAERQVVEARLKAQALWQEETALNNEQRQDLALLAKLEGRPSPAVRVLDAQEKAEFEAELLPWYADPLQTAPRQDRDVLPVHSSPQEARNHHDARWRAALDEVQRVQSALAKGEPLV